MKRLIFIALICLSFVGCQSRLSKEIDYYEKIIEFDNTIGEEYRSKHDYICDYCEQYESDLYEWIDIFGNYHEAHYGTCADNLLEAYPNK